MTRLSADSRQSRSKALMQERHELALPSDTIASRSFSSLRLRRGSGRLRASSRSKRRPLSLTSQPLNVLDYVEAFYYEWQSGKWAHRIKSYPYTYPAIVLAKHTTRAEVVLLYLSDGLISDSGKQALSYALVPIGHVMPCSDLTRKRLNGTSGSTYTVPTYNELESVRVKGVETYLERM